MNRYIFTVTAGRSGQNTLTNLIDSHVKSSYVAFEEPQINYFFKGKIASIERKFRRKFVETHELLGRGKILTSFMAGDVEYIKTIANRKINIINKKLKNNTAHIYIDISKYFARGLHIGIQEILPAFSLIHLVRDPILNMRSFLNRNKNFYLDNNAPSSKYNILVLDSKNMEKSELYLWAWCEMALRYESMKRSQSIDKYAEIHTKKLNDPGYINKCLDDLGLDHDIVQENNIILNTNRESGYKKTEVTKIDIEIFESFIDKLPSNIVNDIPYLNSYSPCSVHNIL